MIRTANRIANVEEYYFSRKLQEVKSLDTPGHPVINLGIGSPDQPPSPKVIETLIHSAKEPTHHAYQNYRGIPAFREAIARFYHSVYKVSLKPETMVLPLIGSKEGIMHISMAFVNEGDTVLIPDPGYPTYATVARLLGAEVLSYNMREENNWGIDFDELNRLDLSRVRLMWINFPHMPTGRVATEEELKKLVDLARRHDFLIVNDNPYSLVLNDEPLSLLSVENAADVALELNSLSKSHNMAGWRLGWVAGKKEYVDAVLRVKSNMDSGMFLPLQHAAVQALSNGESWFKELNDQYAQRRTVVRKILDTLGCTYSRRQAGLFVWAKAPAEVEDVERWVDEVLYGSHVFMTPGFIFGDAGKRFVRLSLCNPVEVLGEALKRIQKFALEQVQ